MATADQGETPVERWAATVKDAPVRLREVERRVLLGHPHARSTWLGFEMARPVPGPVAALVALIGLFAPLGGMLALLGYRGPSRGEDFGGFRPEFGVPLAGWCFVVAGLYAAVLVAGWWSGGRRRETRPFGMLAFVLVPAVIAIPMVRARLAETWVSPSWAVPVLAAAAIAAGGLVLVLAATSRAPAPVTSDELRRDRYWVPLDLGVIDDRERTQLLAVRERTLQMLARREVIDASIAERAATLPLGDLGLLDQPEDA
ncbi:hypothetical protein [Pseudactinotalea sp.]|uniref:hypothetical protein n=1 Tax=Pseudactinotalea sp. TaxID=1926260 RepID=UPI003B3B0BB3